MLGLDAEGLVQERPTWHAAELAAAMHLAQDALRKRALFWIGHGVLEETRTPTGTVSIPHTAVCLLTLQCLTVSAMGHLWMATGVPMSIPSAYQCSPSAWR